MPAVSQSQRRLMFWAKSHPKAAAAKGIKPKVAEEFTAADPGGKLPEHVKDGKPIKSRGDRWYGPKDD
jgi:hypothetical protein